LKKEFVREVEDRYFINLYSTKFSKFLQDLSSESRDMIRKNKELGELFDLFLDFILDASQHLDYKYVKEKEKKLEQF